MATPYRVVNTADQVPGPHGLNYMHDASRPLAVLYGTGQREICIGRYSNAKAARARIAAHSQRT